ncbi:mannitol dehydrogenase family protein [Brenneria goodwinii]|uniref:D-arabinitol 4-dehydrogenase n=1 Tax=Brenneria goodwinii TaxID=1109412 RepID=UPI000EF1E37C|nr:D-arabinitol 4-dehydrogenase [Brenneria goodwinii]MCG8157413.1 mannitol dehydrogenase family protein [Brenneria goodwinii]MCG8161986.1 mannitol dehydrogenase family protein [Brenneria goodwinii]MCG8165227.1 mannitol dehydrogenase family protein [Brenneria goodwinii]MCG8170924.1 mannitol dehydrogenase family protein [Brenneria goodwinii]MCG8176110.1 mannitol dehydrogenase family protein [Brenneria goodwinii]
MPIPTKNTSTWLHLGAGAFFRAHQAWYLNQLRRQGDNHWHMALSNIRNSSTQKTLQQLKSQNGLYTLETISPEGERSYETIDAVDQILLWDSRLASTVAVGAAPSTEIISFTVTEGGYFLDDDGHLDLSHPAIKADLRDEGEINTLYGALTLILTARQRQKSGPVTLLCCDNLSQNGDSFSQGMREFLAAKQRSDLIDWMAEQTAAPNSMVDRITPKFDDSLYERIAQQGITGDAAPLSCESFARWVIEDRFAGKRPALEQVGVEFVDDVTPVEEAKIRLLNASHSGIAWAGALQGKRYIDESLPQYVTDWIRDYVLQDVGPALQQRGIDLDLPAECDSVLARFGNRWVRDTVARVSSDSIAKLHGFIVPTLKDCYRQGTTPQATLRLPALFFLFLQRYHNNALPFSYEDRAIDSIDVESIFTADDPLAAFADQAALFGMVRRQKNFTDHLRAAVDEVETTFHALKGE